AADRGDLLRLLGGEGERRPDLAQRVGLDHLRTLGGLLRGLHAAEPFVGGPAWVPAAQVDDVLLEPLVHGARLQDLREQLELSVDLVIALALDAQEEQPSALLAVPE